MKGAVLGLWHVRGGPAMTAVLAVVVAVVYAAPLVVVEVSVAFGQPARGVGAFELGAMTLSSVLPALTTPTLDGREHLATGPPRIVHCGVSGLVLCAPLLVLPVWFHSVTRDPRVDLPALHGFVTNLLLYASIGFVLVHLVGRAASVLLGPLAFAGFTVGQQVWPDSPLTWWWATPDHPTGEAVPTVLVVCVALGCALWRHNTAPR